MIKADIDAAREELISRVLGARTLPEITEAKEELRAWLSEHPDEPGMADGFEALSHREDFARMQEESASEPKAAAK
jgi:hypothetical protein